MHTKSKKASLITLAGILIISALFIGASGTARSARAQAVVWPSLTFTPEATNLHMPVHVTHSGDGSGRLFIVEQRGTVQIHKQGQALKTFMDIQGRVRSPFNNGGGYEEGLLSIAFPPDFAAKGYFYVYYTNLNGDNQVSRFYISADPDAADTASEETILYLVHPTYSNHNGGQLMFGPNDGYLYIGTGDGGGGADPLDNAENPASLLGKLLRIDVEMDRGSLVTGPYQIYLPQVTNTNDNALQYEIPSSNPFVGVSGKRPEIWALGLRNPWRYSFDRQNGDLYIGDVGQNEWEEIDYQPFNSSGGENYGWDNLEGDHCHEPPSGCTIPANYVGPIFEYPHTLGTSITGGYVYRGAAYTNMQGIYFLADYGNGRIWGLQNNLGAWESNAYASINRRITSFGEDESGELYFTTVDFSAVDAGRLYQMGSTPAP